MFNSPLKVYDEYLIEPADVSAAMAGTNVVRAGESLSGLEVVVCVEPSAADPEVGFDLKVGTEVSILLQHSQDGETFIALPEWNQTVAAPKDDPAATTITAAPGTIIARMTLPSDCLPFVKGNLEFAAGSGGAVPTGRVSMFPAYLPR